MILTSVKFKLLSAIFEKFLPSVTMGYFFLARHAGNIVITSISFPCATSNVCNVVEDSKCFSV
jgi:hypothetical protein